MSQTAFEKVCTFAGRAVNRFAMIEAGDRILVGLSGGKDSTVLGHVLTHLQRRAPVRFELFFVTFDPGFANMHLDRLHAYCAKHNWAHSFEHLDMPVLLRAKNLEARPCSFCARMRRGRLYAAADRLDCNKIALGQHLDDLCATLLINLFRGHGLKTMGANVTADTGRKRVIRPLCLLREDVIAAAAEQLGCAQVNACEHEATVLRDGDRAQLQQLISTLDNNFTNIRENMLASMSHVEVEHLLDNRWLQSAGG